MANELLQELRRKTEQGGGAEKVDEQHKKNKLTARERIGLLLDGQSFLETDVFAAGTTGVDAPGEGVVTGFGTVNGRPVYVYAQDFTVLGGSVGAAHAAKISRVMDQAAKVGAPVVALLDSAGARLQEGFAALAGYGEIYRRAARIRGAVPQIGVVCGPCIGAAAYGAALMDFVFLAQALDNRPHPGGVSPAFARQADEDFCHVPKSVRALSIGPIGAGNNREDTRHLHFAAPSPVRCNSWWFSEELGRFLGHFGVEITTSPRIALFYLVFVA